MSTIIQSLKHKLRTRILKRLKNQKEVERLRKSFVLYKKLFSLPEFIKAKTILFYMSFDGEVETHHMIDKALALGKRVAIPLLRKNTNKLEPSLLIESGGYDLEIGPYGIYQPIAAHRRPVGLDGIDCVVVPAVAFDRHGNRLGRGKGCYDRLLRSLSPAVPTIGLAFDFQVVPRLPVIDSVDFPVRKVLCA